MSCFTVLFDILFLAGFFTGLAYACVWAFSLPANFSTSFVTLGESLATFLRDIFIPFICVYPPLNSVFIRSEDNQAVNTTPEKFFGNNLRAWIKKARSVIEMNPYVDLKQLNECCKGTPIFASFVFVLKKISMWTNIMYAMNVGGVQMGCREDCQPLL